MFVSTNQQQRRTLSEIKEWWMAGMVTNFQLKARPREVWLQWQNDNPLHPDFNGMVENVGYLPKIYV